MLHGQIYKVLAWVLFIFKLKTKLGVGGLCYKYKEMNCVVVITRSMLGSSINIWVEKC
jgi:hypothetical protein